jgi:hypothetical protein
MGRGRPLAALDINTVTVPSTSDSTLTASHLPSYSPHPSSPPHKYIAVPSSIDNSNENVDTSNRRPVTPLPSCSSSPKPAHDVIAADPPPISNDADAAAAAEWCRCSHCTSDDVKGSPVCCLDVADAEGRHVYGDSRGECGRPEIIALIRDGPSESEYYKHSKRAMKKTARPDKYAECNAAQKRLVLYGILHTMLYRTGTRGQRDPMPECIKFMVRSAHPREGGNTASR